MKIYRKKSYLGFLCGVLLLAQSAYAEKAERIQCRTDLSDEVYPTINPSEYYIVSGKSVRSKGIHWNCLARKGLQIRMKEGAEPVLFDFAKPIDLYRYFEPLKGSNLEVSSVSSRSLAASDLNVSGNSHFANTLAIEDGAMRLLRTTEVDFANNRLRNLADATDSQDAVNLGQVNRLLGDLEHRFEQSLQDYTTKKAHFSGIATSMAMSALPHASLPGDRVIGIGTGSYGSAFSFAAGASYVSESGHWLYKASIGVGSTLGANAGMAYAW